MQEKNGLSDAPSGELIIQLFKNSLSRTFLVDRILSLDVPDSVKVNFIRSARSGNGIDATKMIVSQFETEPGGDQEDLLLKSLDWAGIGRVFENQLGDADPQGDKPAEKSWVYFIESATSGLIKIGRSINPKDRFAAIRTMSPDELTLLGAIPEGQVTESDLHKKFSHLRRHGEWFEDCLEIREYLGGLELSA